MDHVILHELGPFDDVAQQAGVIGYGDAQGIFHGPHRRDGVHGCADATDALRKVPRIARIAALEDQLQPAKHGAGAPGVGNDAVFHLHLDTHRIQMMKMMRNPKP